MKIYGGVEVSITIIEGRFTPLPLYLLEKHLSSTLCIGSWVSPRISLDITEKRKILRQLGIESQFLCRSAHSQVTLQYIIKITPNYMQTLNY
jgi:hypothetical protein